MSLSMRWVATHPLTLMAAELCHAAIMMGFTSCNSFWRLATLPFPLWVIWVGTQQARLGTYGSMIQPLVTGYAVTYVLDYIDRVLLQRWAFEVGGPMNIFGSNEQREVGPAKNNTGESTGLKSSFWARLMFGLHAATSRRHLNTPYEVKNCRHFSSQDKNYVPSCSRFILGALGSFIACYLFIDINDANAQSGQDSSLFAPHKVPFFARLHDVSPEELIVRFITPLIIWVTSYCMIQMTYDLMSIVAVGLRITNVKSWRPVFGSIWNAYTVRKFWGWVTTWHVSFKVGFGTDLISLAQERLAPTTPRSPERPGDNRDSRHFASTGYRHRPAIHQDYYLLFPIWSGALFR